MERKKRNGGEEEKTAVGRRGRNEERMKLFISETLWRGEVEVGAHGVREQNDPDYNLLSSFLLPTLAWPAPPSPSNLSVQTCSRLHWTNQVFHTTSQVNVPSISRQNPLPSASEGNNNGQKTGRNSQQTLGTLETQGR